MVNQAAQAAVVAMVVLGLDNLVKETLVFLMVMVGAVVAEQALHQPETMAEQV
jgi:hypothetical protein